MKECNRQLQKQPCQLNSRSELIYDGGFEDGWREALKLIQTEIEIGDKTESYGEDILIAIQKKIKEELGEEG